MPELLKGKYMLDECIGRGGMAEVFAARTVGAAGFSQRVAIKRIHPVHGGDAQFREMFVAEARLGAHLRHSNVVRVLDFDEDEAGCLFLVMEYVDGVDLAGLLRTGPLPLPAILFVVGEMLRGLAYVHELPPVEGAPRGLVHRDVSPQNVLLSWDGSVQLSDFGIAKARTATQAGASVMLKGKPSYMSPEQVRRLPLDGRSDVFAAGIMLWEMLCDEALFRAPDDVRATLAAVMFGEVPRPSEHASRPVPDDVERVTLRMLRKDRETRWDAATALAALAACADYPRSGREALAALLAERLPERAPRSSAPRPAEPEQVGGRPAPQGSADGAARSTAVAMPRGRPGAMPVRDHRSVIRRAHRRALRAVLLGGAAIGALVGATLQVVLPGDEPAAALRAPVPAASIRPGLLEPAPPSVAPRAEAARTPAPPPPEAASPPELPGAARNETSARARQPRAESASPAVRQARAPASAPAPSRSAPRSGMRVIDLRPETPEPGATGQPARGARELDLGPPPLR